MKQAIRGRIFIVGCPRSGTTLLQSLLAANSHIASFPESVLFGHLLANGRLSSALGIASRKARSNWNAYLERIGHREMKHKLPRFAIFVRQYFRAFVAVLDTLAADQGKNVWIEKTPGYLRKVEQIEALVIDAKLIHIIRNGVDVVASLYDVTNSYPEEWGGAGWSIDQCIERWLEDTRLGMMYAPRKNHSLVTYEELVEEPRLVLARLCEFIEVPYEERMLSDYPIAAKQLILENEPWKASTSQLIRSTSGSKFYTLFDEDQRQYILKRLSESQSASRVEERGQLTRA